MNKKTITLKMSKDAGITSYQAEKAFHSLLLGVMDSLKHNERVTFSGFGSFETVLRKARTGRNPKTGESIHIAPKRRIRFIPSRMFSDKL